MESIATENQSTNSPVNAHLISGPTGSTETNKIGQSKPRVIIYINFVQEAFHVYLNKLKIVVTY